MKGIHLDPHRGYRERCAPRDGEHGFQLVIGETDLRVTAVSPLPEGFKDALAARVRTLRGELEAWIVLHPEFRHSLVPVQLSCSAPPPEIVRRMTEASAIAGVGPFAAVAGTIAQMAAESLVDRSPDLICAPRTGRWRTRWRRRCATVCKAPATSKPWWAMPGAS